MGAMTDTPEAPERVALHYTGSNSVRLADSAHANPLTIHPDTVVVVDKWAADNLVQGDAFRPAAGTSLDDALRTADLSTSGTADEKRDRLAAHEADLAAALVSAAVAEAPDDTQES